VSSTYERQPSCRHLIKHSAQGKQIAALIQFLSACLLGRHICDRSQGYALIGQVVAVRKRGQSCSAIRARHRRSARNELRQPKIKHLGLLSTGDKYVCRLEVAVNDAGFVRRIQRVCNLDREIENLRTV
jgi:hypothetical protein